MKNPGRIRARVYGPTDCAVDHLGDLGQTDLALQIRTMVKLIGI